MTEGTRDNSTNFYPGPSAPDITGLAVALGRIEEGQKNLKEAVGEVKVGVSGITETLGQHAILITTLTNRADAADRNQAELSAKHQPWYVIVGGLSGVTAIAVSIWALIHP
jgi:uncharacterized membrane protein YdcZ (DUF606 family)